MFGLKAAIRFPSYFSNQSVAKRTGSFRDSANAVCMSEMGRKLNGRLTCKAENMRSQLLLRVLFRRRSALQISGPVTHKPSIKRPKINDIVPTIVWVHRPTESKPTS